MPGSPYGPLVCILSIAGIKLACCGRGCRCVWAPPQRQADWLVATGTIATAALALLLATRDQLPSWLFQAPSAEDQGRTTTITLTRKPVFARTCARAQSETKPGPWRFPLRGRRSKMRGWAVSWVGFRWCWSSWGAQLAPDRARDHRPRLQRQPLSRSIRARARRRRHLVSRSNRARARVRWRRHLLHRRAGSHTRSRRGATASACPPTGI